MLINMSCSMKGKPSTVKYPAWPANYPPLFIPTFLIQPSNNNKVESLSLES